MKVVITSRKRNETKKKIKMVEGELGQHVRRWAIRRERRTAKEEVVGGRRMRRRRVGLVVHTHS